MRDCDLSEKFSKLEGMACSQNNTLGLGLCLDLLEERLLERGPERLTHTRFVLEEQVVTAIPVAIVGDLTHLRLEYLTTLGGAPHMQYLISKNQCIP